MLGEIAVYINEFLCILYENKRKVGEKGKTMSQLMKCIGMCQCVDISFLVEHISLAEAKG